MCTHIDGDRGDGRGTPHHKNVKQFTKGEFQKLLKLQKVQLLFHMFMHEDIPVSFVCTEYRAWQSYSYFSLSTHRIKKRRFTHKTLHYFFSSTLFHYQCVLVKERNFSRRSVCCKHKRNGDVFVHEHMKQHDVDCFLFSWPWKVIFLNGP